MPAPYDRRKMAALVAVMVTLPVFKSAVRGIRELMIAPSGTGHVRPAAAGSLSDWFGLQAAARAHDDTMLIPATVKDIGEHVQKAISLVHPLATPGSRLPDDVKDAIAWVADQGTQVPGLRHQRLESLARIHSSLAVWNDKLWNEGAVEHVRGMRAYTPALAFIHACVVAMEWPHTNLVVDMAVGAASIGAQPDTGVWRRDPPKEKCDCFEDLKATDTTWNERLYSSVRAEGLKPENHALAWAAWERTEKEVAAGWCSPVVGGYAELNSRFGEGSVRIMRRFGVMQNGACRCCDSATASGHNPCTSHEERLTNVRADFPLESAAQFATHLEIDGTWTMHVSTNDVVAAFRRVACADPSTTIVAQWDPRPLSEGGQRVKLFYVQGFNFGLKSAVMAYNAVAEFQTRAAVRLIPIVACHYFDDWCCAEPDYSCSSAQRSLEQFMRLTGLDVDGVVGRDNNLIPAKKQWPSMVQKFLGVVADFTNFRTSGKVRMYVPQARIEKVQAMIAEAIAKGELSKGETSSLCGKLQFCLSWGVGRFGRAAMGPLYRHIRARRPAILTVLEMSLNFLQTALTSLRARDICVRATSRSAPVLVWSDATGTNEGEGQPVIAFVARFPGGSPAPTDPPGVTMQHPRWVHGYSIVSPELIAELDARKQQIGQLELLAAAASYFSLATWLSNRDVFHYIDNTAAVAGIAKGYSAKPDSARIIHAYHALNVKMQAQVHFEWVKSEANIADLPTRGQFELLQEFASKEIPLIVPPISDWLTPDETVAHVFSAPLSQKRGGKRGRG
jgi:hypothetical protein